MLMVNSIPAYVICSGGTFAVFGGCPHSYSSQIKGESRRTALASCRENKSDIYIDDRPIDHVPSRSSGLANKTVFLAGNLVVAAISEDNGSQNAITIASDSPNLLHQHGTNPGALPRRAGPWAAADESRQGASLEPLWVGDLSAVQTVHARPFEIGKWQEAKIVASDLTSNRVKSLIARQSSTKLQTMEH